MPAACAPRVVSSAVMIVITISATLFSVFLVLSFMGLKTHPQPLPLGRGAASALWGLGFV